MNWWGKIGLGSLGWAIGGPIGGLIGAAIGQVIDSEIDENQNRERFGNNISDDEYSGILLSTVIILMAKMAKADGIVTQDEVNLVKNIMINELEFTGSSFDTAKKLFNESKNDSTDYEIYLQQFKDITTNNFELRKELLNILYRIAVSDGIFSNEEKTMLYNIAETLQILEQYNFLLNNTQNATNSSDEYYEILGCKSKNVPNSVKAL